MIGVGIVEMKFFIGEAYQAALRPHIVPWYEKDESDGDGLHSQPLPKG
jgi:hypothetical protein